MPSSSRPIHGKFIRPPQARSFKRGPRRTTTAIRARQYIESREFAPRQAKLPAVRTQKLKVQFFRNR